MQFITDNTNTRRNRPMKKFTLFAVLIILVASFTVAMAEPRGKPGGKDFGREGKRSPYANLNLTEEQKSKIDAMRESLRKEMTPIRTDLIKKKMELDLLWMEDSPEGDKIKAKQKEIRDLRGTIEDRLTDFRLNVNSILTPEQRAELMAKRAQGRSSFPKDKKQYRR
jgi:Spy/CpxP family protein refolding chaperone